jgi:hypothetical protein
MRRLGPALLLLFGCGFECGLVGCRRAPDVTLHAVPLTLDREERVDNQPLTPSTQSVNRYRSVLARFDAADLELDGRRGRLRVQLDEHGRPAGLISIENVALDFLVPRLDYPHGRRLTPFDRVNLVLSEYSRSGVELSLQERNREYGYFRSRGLFNDEEEYRFEDGRVVPNPGARPKRMSLTNNCLAPGLWEISAADSVGELYHAWLSLPESGYLALVRAANRLDATDEELRAALAYPKDFGPVALDLDRLRTNVRSLGSFPVAVDLDKPVASYSTQDSRRKVQRKFYTVERDGKPIEPVHFSDLRPGDQFRFFSFVAPGIYTREPPRRVPYEPIWTTAELAEVTPRTRFSAPSPHRYSLGALEITLRSSDGTRAIVVGNLPVDLLVFQEDFDVPGFGVGVLRASEPIEKRHLYWRDGPAPVYAYSAFVRDGRLVVANNHEQGLEQIYLRPFRRGSQVVLSVTLVAYERIVDILALEIPLPAELGARIIRASEEYQRPLWRSFSDSNLL